MKRIANYLIVLALAVFAFTSCEDVPSPFGQIVAPKSEEGEVIEPSGKGTLAEPYNVAGVIEYLSGLGADVPSPTDVYIKGVITSITEAFGTQYGNATFEISDTENASNKFLCYRVKYLGNTSYSDPSALNIKEGNTVIICGKVVNYKGNTPETSANAAYVYSINGQGGSGGGGGGDTPSGDLGTKDAPITVAQALAAINKLADGGETGDAYVKGIISKVQSFNATYKSITYYISDDGKETSELQVYSGKGLNGADFAAKEDLAAGDIVVVKGKLKKYVKGDLVTPEINQSSEIISLTKGSGGGGTSGDAKGTGTANDPFNIAAAIAKCKEIGTTASTEKYYVKGIVVKGGKVSGGYGNVTFDMGDSQNATDIFKAFQVAGSDGEKLADGYEVKAGSEVIIYGPIYNYNGNTPETAGKSAAQIVTIDGKKTNESGGGGGESGAAKGSGTEADPFNVAAAIAKCQQVGETASTEKYYIKGIADAEYTVTSYKNVEVDIVDQAGSSDKFKVFRVKDKDGKGIKVGYKIAKGATIIVYGPVVNYKGNTPETATGAYLVSVNGQAPELDGEGGGGTSGGGGSAATSLTNGDFETWANGLPTGWKSTSTASSATLAQSTDAHGGKYSCNVNGDESQNKRLASQEITLAAGTYVFSAWIKATTSDVAQARPGYVPIGADGKAGSYAYGDYANLTTSWQQFSYEFTLDSEKTVCLVIMNPKKSNYSSGTDILVDDATLTKK